MNYQRVVKDTLFLLTASLLILLFSSSLPTASAAPIQLKNDNNTPAIYNNNWSAGDIIGAVLTPQAAMYPVRVTSVEFILYRFEGADDSTVVRACIYSINNGRPGARLGCSNSTTITIFSPRFVSVSLASSEIVISSPGSFMAAIRFRPVSRTR